MQMLYNSDSFVVVRFELAPMPAGPEPALSQGGYEIVDKFTRKEIFIVGALGSAAAPGVEVLVLARIVIGVEGSHLSHAIFTMADDAAFLVLQPPDRFAMTYKEFADRMSMRFAFMVGTAAEDGFTVDHDRLRRIIDRVS